MRSKLIIILTLILLFSCTKKQDDNMILSKITFLQGDIILMRQGRQIEPKINMKLFPEDAIITKKDAKANIIISDFGICRIKENTRIKISELFKQAKLNNVKLNIQTGKLIIGLKKLTKGNTFSIDTPTAVVGVRGTTFLVNVESKKGMPVTLKVAVLSGNVEIINIQKPEEKKVIEELKEGTLPAGDFTKFKIRKIPEKPFNEINQISELKEIEEYKFKNIKEEITAQKSKIEEKAGEKASKKKELEW